MIGADAEFPRNALEGVRSIAKKYNLKIVYDKNYPPSTTDFTPVVRAVAADQSRHLLRLLLSARLGRPHPRQHEIGFKPKMLGGGMVGLQATAIKTQLGPLLNGIVVYDFWLPWAGFAIDAGRAFLKKYQTKSAEAGVDPLGYYLGGCGYAYAGRSSRRSTGPEHRGRQARRLHPEDHLQDHPRRLEFIAGRRVEQVAVMAGAVSTASSRARPGDFMNYQTVLPRPTNTRPATLIYPYEKAK